MSDTEFIPFKQVPVWDEKEKFEITGEQLNIILGFCDAYQKFGRMFEGFLEQQVLNGKIGIKYEDADGNELSKDKIQAMFLQMHKETNVEPQVS